MKALETAKISNLSPDDFTLYQISKSKKYDFELAVESAEARGEARGEVKRDVKYVLLFHSRVNSPQEISDLLGLPLDYVLEIIENYSKK